MKTCEGDEAFEVPVIDVLLSDKRRDSLGRSTLGARRRDVMLRQFFESGLSQSAFARREGLCYTTFAGWVQKHRRASDAYTSDTHRTLKSPTPKKPATMGPAMRFREVAIPAGNEAPAKGVSSGLTVVLPGGIEVRGCDVAGAVELIRSLREGR